MLCYLCTGCCCCCAMCTTGTKLPPTHYRCAALSCPSCSCWAWRDSKNYGTCIFICITSLSLISQRFQTWLLRHLEFLQLKIYHHIFFRLYTHGRSIARTYLLLYRRSRVACLHRRYLDPSFIFVNWSIIILSLLYLCIKRFIWTNTNYFPSSASMFYPLFVRARS